ncbi:MAG TPA: nucleotide sugar dehydrogenase [Candidatus Paceibacterota bacterium]
MPKAKTTNDAIAIVGLGYVGLTLGLVLAEAGLKVIGFDTNKKVLDGLRENEPHFWENGLKELLKKHNGKNFTLAEKLAPSYGIKTYFIAVGTPLGKDGKPNLAYLKSASEMVGDFLKQGNLVISRSTVPLGTNRSLVLPILERRSNLKAGSDFHLAFVPERTVEGKALEELWTLPEVIGGFTKESGEKAKAVFDNLKKPSVVVDSLEEAEMVKLLNNVYRSVVFSFADELSLICDKWGLDTKKVIEAANAGYERSKVPLPAPGVGGPCLLKDVQIFIQSGRSKGYEPGIASEAYSVTGKTIKFIANQVRDFLKKSKKDFKQAKVFILGFAFKGVPETSDMRGSTTIPLVQELKKLVKNIYGYDPKVPNEHIAGLGVQAVSKLEDGFKLADAVIFMNNHPGLKSIDLSSMIQLAHNPVFIFDAWGLHENAEFKINKQSSAPKTILAGTDYKENLMPKKSLGVFYKRL